MRRAVRWWWARARWSWRPVWAAVSWWVWWCLDHDARAVAAEWRADIGQAKSAGTPAADLWRMRQDRDAAVAEVTTDWRARAAVALAGLIGGTWATVATLGTVWTGLTGGPRSAVGAVLIVIIATAVAGQVAGAGHHVTTPEGDGDDTAPGPVVAPEWGAWLRGGLGSAVPAVRRARSGGPLVWAVRPHAVEGGVSATAVLPGAATAGDVLSAREALSSALDVAPARLVLSGVEGAPTSHLRVTVLDVAPSGEVGRWPLADGAPVDLSAVPIGVTVEGEPVEVALLERSWLFGGAPDTGKTVSMRAVVTAAVLAGARVRVIAGKGGADWAPLAGRADVESSADDDVTARAALAALRAADAEWRRRATVFRDRDIERVSHAPDVLSEPGLGLELVTIDECAEVFGHAELGAEIADLFSIVARKGPGFGVSCMAGTQFPGPDSIPARVMKACTVRVCGHVPDVAATNATLGPRAHGRGWRASELSQDDPGVTWVVAGGRGRLVRWYHVTAAMIRQAVPAAPVPAPDLVDTGGVSREMALGDLLDLLDSAEAGGVPPAVALIELQRLWPDRYGGMDEVSLRRLVRLGTDSVRWDGASARGWRRKAIEEALGGVTRGVTR